MSRQVMELSGWVSLGVQLDDAIKREPRKPDWRGVAASELRRSRSEAHDESVSGSISLLEERRAIAQA